MSLDVDQVFGVAGSHLQFARVDDYEYVLDGSGAPLLDVNNLPIPTGRLNITLDKGGPREGVPFALPTAGNSAFIGSLPEKNALCVVGFREQLKPVIICFLPTELEGVISNRGTIPAMKPGEVLLQASNQDVTDEGRNETFVGASVKLDAYGRIIAQTQDYKLVIGGLLSDEYTPEVVGMDDPITGKQIYLLETLPGGVSRRVDNDGSAVWGYAKHKYERIGQNLDVQVGGTATTEVANGQTYKDRKNNSFGLDGDGNFSANLATGGVTLDTQGGHTFRSGGLVTRHTIKSVREQVGGNMELLVGKLLTQSAFVKSETVTGLYTLIVGGALAQTIGGAIALTAGGITTILSPQILLGAAPKPLVNFPGFSAIVGAIAGVLSGLVPGSGAAITALLPAATTVTVQGT